MPFILAVGLVSIVIVPAAAVTYLGIWARSLWQGRRLDRRGSAR